MKLSDIVNPLRHPFVLCEPDCPDRSSKILGGRHCYICGESRHLHEPLPRAIVNRVAMLARLKYKRAGWRDRRLKEPCR